MNSQHEIDTSTELTDIAAPFRSLLLVAGVCLSIVIYKSQGDTLPVPQADLPQTMIHQAGFISNSIYIPDSKQVAVEKNALKSMNTHQNFISAYLLQESSFRRTNKIPQSEGTFVRHLRDIGKFIYSATTIHF